MKECGFCFQKVVKLSGEHIYSDWMNELFREPWERRFTLPDGRVFTFPKAALDWKEKVACGACNNGWMSDIEEKHARPTLTPLIVGQIGIPITQSAARSMAIFAFKTAAVLDLMPIRQRQKKPYFSKRIRAAFREKLTIPPSVWMWMCPYVAANYRADTFATNYHGDSPIIGPIHLYVCTYAIGHFVFQVVSLKSIHSGAFRLAAGDPTFNKAAIQFWPNLIPNFVWPNRLALRTVEELGKFHRRWEGIFPIVR
jgi:hypothetical protein